MFSQTHEFQFLVLFCFVLFFHYEPYSTWHAFTKKKKKKKKELHNLCSDIYPYKVVGIENAAVLNGNDIDISLQCLSIWYSIKISLVDLNLINLLRRLKCPVFRLLSNNSPFPFNFFFSRFVIQKSEKPKPHHYGDIHVPFTFSLENKSVNCTQQCNWLSGAAAIGSFL